MNVLIIEDELIISEMMSEMISEMGYTIVGQAIDYKESIQCLNDANPDIALVDVNLNDEKDGIDLAAYINKNIQIPFIFVTSNADAATVNRAKEEQPFGYLQKPFNSDDLYAAIEVAMVNFGRLNKQQNKDPEQNGLKIKDSIFVKDGTLYVKISFKDLVYIKSDGNYLELRTRNKKHLIRSSMKEFLPKLPEGLFLNTHRSYVVNIENIDEIGSSFIKVAGFEVPLVKQWREGIEKRLL